MADLNRQRLYLLAALKIDAQQAATHGRAFWAGRLDEAYRPASEWRWMPYGRWLHLSRQPPTPLRQEIGRDEIDPGTGSTWAALARRGLLEVEDREVYGVRPTYVLPHVKLTPRGRKLARHLSGDTAPPPPRGVISPWTWRALALAWQAGEEGLPQNEWGNYGGIGWGTWLVLRNRRHGGDLVEEFVHHRVSRPRVDAPGNTERVYHIRLTAAGRAYYRERWAVYHAEYPEVEAPDPR